MTTTVYVLRPTTERSEEGEKLFECQECHLLVPATASDTHAKRSHRSDTVRIFQNERTFTTWMSQQS